MSGRIGLIGGLSWMATAEYYRYANQLYLGPEAWSQPPMVIESVDFAAFVPLQQANDWDATGTLLVEAAQRLEGAGATVLAIGANTMHKNYDVVADAVSIPVLDVRTCVADEVKAKRGSALALLGTKYVLTQDFYVDALRAQGLDVVLPNDAETEELQRLIYDELTRGVVREESKAWLESLIAQLVDRGANAVGLCCTELGLLIEETDAPVPVIDSTKAHVRALLATLS